MARDIVLAEDKVYAAIGSDGFTRLVGAFYRRVRMDDVLAPMYPNEDFDGAETRLRTFLIGRFGGPNDYIATRGHPRLRMRHAPFQVNQTARDRWMKLMDEALIETSLPSDAAETLRAFFHDTSMFLINRQT